MVFMTEVGKLHLFKKHLSKLGQSQTHSTVHHYLRHFFPHRLFVTRTWALTTTRLYLMRTFFESLDSIVKHMVTLTAERTFKFETLRMLIVAISFDKTIKRCAIFFKFFGAHLLPLHVKCTKFGDKKSTHNKPNKQNQSQKHRFPTHAFKLCQTGFHAQSTHRHRKNKSIQKIDFLDHH